MAGHVIICGSRSY